MDMKIYIADTSALCNEKLFLHYLSEVSEYRKCKIDVIKPKAKKALSLGAGLLFKKALADIGLSEKNAIIKKGDNNKPYIINYPNIHFNLSHSEERAMCVISDCEVGCDTEKIRSFNINIAKRFFSEEEQDLINISENKKDVFFKIWTLKESFLKATGKGLNLPLDSFSICKDTSIDFEGKKYFCKEVAFDGGYKYAVCSCNDNILLNPEFITF